MFVLGHGFKCFYLIDQYLLLCLCVHAIADTADPGGANRASCHGGASQ